MGGRALPLPVRQPLDAPYQQPHPHYMEPGHAEPEHRRVGRQASHTRTSCWPPCSSRPSNRSTTTIRSRPRQGYEAGPQHRGYLFKVHVDETEELAYETGKKYLEGPGNIFLEGSRATANRYVQMLPGMTSRTNVLPTAAVRAVAASRGRDGRDNGSYPAGDQGGRPGAGTGTSTYQHQLDDYAIVTGTPKTVSSRRSGTSSSTFDRA